jgi:hypothetical protein
MSGRMAKPHLIPRTQIYGFFVLGLLSALAFRGLMVLQHVEPSWVRPA